MNCSIFSSTYWRTAVSELKNLRKLIFAAFVCALAIVVGALYIPVGQNLRVYFTFFITSVGCAVYGPVVGVLTAAVTDTLNFFLFPSGPYFPGYLLSEMVGALIYSLFLYRRKITILRLFLSKFLINYVVNVFMGSIWSEVLFGKGYLYYLTKSLIKNTLLLPVEVIVMAMIFAAILPVFSRFHLLPEHSTKSRSHLQISFAAILVLGIDLITGGIFSFVYAITTESDLLLFGIIGGVLILAGLVLSIIGLIRRRKFDQTI